MTEPRPRRDARPGDLTVAVDGTQPSLRRPPDVYTRFAGWVVKVQRAALLQVLNELERAGEQGIGLGARLVQVCVRVLEVTGAGIMLMNDGKHGGTLGLSDPTVGVIEELQFTLGEGPCLDAYHEARPVSEPSLEHPTRPRWPLFTGPALRAGVAAKFAFPLQVRLRAYAFAQQTPVNDVARSVIARELRLEGQ